MKELNYINNIKNNIDIDVSLDYLYTMHCKIYYKVIHKYFNDDKFLEKERRVN